MKLKTLPVLAILLILLLSVACGKKPGGQLIMGSCDAFDSQPHAVQTINIAAGDSFAVVLCSNSTTGFQWSEPAQVSDPSVVQQMDHKLISSEGAVGAPGNEIWTFLVRKKGVTTITFEYSQPWEGGEKGVWTLDLIVVVK